MNNKTKIIILTSLLLNILLIGLIIGYVSHRAGRERPYRKQGHEFAVKLPPDKQELFFETMKQVHAENRGIHRRMRASRKRTIQILTAPEFDAAAYQGEVEQIHKLRGHMMQRLADATTDLAKQLNQEERKALAEHLMHPPRPSSDSEDPKKGPGPMKKGRGLGNR